MAEQQGIVDPEICTYFSNMNLDEVHIAYGGLGTCRTILQHIEGDNLLYTGGYELTPTRRLARSTAEAGFHDNVRQVGDAIAPLVGRLHQAWAPSFNQLDSMKDVGVVAVMPESRSSLRILARMSRQLGHVPLVVYAGQRDERGALLRFHDFGHQNQTQLLPEDVASLGQPNYRAYHDSLWQRGIQKVVVDNSKQSGPDAYEWWNSTLDEAEAAGTLIGGLHAAAGRVDSKQDMDRKRSVQELRALLEGPEALGSTAMGAILGKAYGLWQRQRTAGRLPDARIKEVCSTVDFFPRPGEDWGPYFQRSARNPVISQMREEAAYRRSTYGSPQTLPVTVEVPYQGLVAVRGKKLPHVSRADFSAMHRDIVHSLHAYFAQLAVPSAAVL
jgi:hypothetical protein